jgi:superoxide dismutase, Cu-Zn family
MNALRRTAVAAAALALAACQSTGGGMPEAPKVAAPLPGVEAVMRAVGGSASQGDAKFMLRGDRLAVLVSINNVVPGPYRVSLNERGNCTSPNAFSAGKPWVPAGYARSAVALLPVLAIGPNGNGQLTTTIPAIPLGGPEGLEGRAVLVHMGSTVDADVVPDRPNRVILCGAIGPIRSFTEFFKD